MRAQELIEASEVRNRDVDSRKGIFRAVCSAITSRGFDGGKRLRPLDHGLRGIEMISLACFDGLAYSRHRMLSQELQDPYESPRTAHGAVEQFQLGTIAGEARRQLPVPENRGVIQAPGLRPSAAR